MNIFHNVLIPNYVDILYSLENKLLNFSLTRI